MKIINRADSILLNALTNLCLSLNYDVNKLPLGKLSKNTISRGYQALKDLSAVLNDPSTASEHGLTYNEAIGNLSNAFYSLIPHAFGRNRPPVSKMSLRYTGTSWIRARVLGLL